MIKRKDDSANAKPEVASPPTAPDGKAVAEPVTAAAVAPGAKVFWSARARRTAVLAASVALSAALGAVAGAVVATALFAPLPKTDAAGVEERQAMHKAVVHIGKELAALKASVEASGRIAGTQVAKLTDRIDRVERAPAAAETTGSIAAVRPPAVVNAAPPKPAIVEGWVVRDARNGYVLVEGRGEFYQAVPGAPLPGLGPVETIKRQDGHWIVVTPKGIITTMRAQPANSAVLSR